jgi:O-antigen ligase
MTAWLWPVRIGTFQIEISPLKDLLKAWYLFLPLLLWRAGSSLTDEGLSRVLRIWLLTCAALSAIGITQHWTGWPKPQIIPYTPDRFHATMFLGHHLSVASIWIFPAFTALSLAIHRRGPALSGLDRRVLWGIAVLAFVALFFGYSRMLWLGLIVGFLLYPFLVLRGKKIAIAAGVLLVTCVALFQVPAIHMRIASSFGAAERYDLWEANWEFFKLRPVTGVGWRKSGDLSGPFLLQKYPDKKRVFAGHAHNNFLEVVAGTGLIGLGAWLFWIFTVFLIVWRGRKHPIFAALFPGLFTAWVVFHLNGLTQVNFWEGKVLHQMMWAVGLSLIFLARTKPERA